MWIGPYQLIKAGEPLQFDHKKISDYMKKRMQAKYLVDDLVLIRLIVGNGNGSAYAWGCDLSDQYIRINADYTT